MRIDPNTRAQQIQESGDAAASSGRGTAAAAGASAPAGGDTAQLSLDQARVQALAAQVNAFPEIRQEKVAALGQAIRDGSYQVSPEQTAEAVIAELRARPAA